jgi:hypothetical protein
MNLDEIINTLNEGGYNENEISITFKEGINMRGIAKLIKENTSNSEDDVYKKLKDEKYLAKIQNLKNYGVDISSNGQLEALSFIGLNLNDEFYPVKIQKMSSLGLKINNPPLLSMLGQMGFNLNSTSNYQNSLTILVEMNAAGLPVSDINYLQKLYYLGFNFNLKDGLTRFLKLKNYADITRTTALENLVKRNINLNNPFFEEALIKYNRIGLSFNDESFLANEDWLLQFATVIDIDLITTILTSYRTNPGTGAVNNAFIYDQQV